MNLENNRGPFHPWSMRNQCCKLYNISTAPLATTIASGLDASGIKYSNKIEIYGRTK